MKIKFLVLLQCFQMYFGIKTFRRINFANGLRRIKDEIIAKMDKNGKPQNLPKQKNKAQFWNAKWDKNIRTNIIDNNSNNSSYRFDQWKCCHLPFCTDKRVLDALSLSDCKKFVVYNGCNDFFCAEWWIGEVRRKRNILHFYEPIKQSNMHMAQCMRIRITHALAQ